MKGLLSEMPNVIAGLNQFLNSIPAATPSRPRRAFIWRFLLACQAAARRIVEVGGGGAVEVVDDEDGCGGGLKSVAS